MSLLWVQAGPTDDYDYGSDQSAAPEPAAPRSNRVEDDQHDVDWPHTVSIYRSLDHGGGHTVLNYAPACSRECAFRIAGEHGVNMEHARLMHVNRSDNPNKTWHVKNEPDPGYNTSVDSYCPPGEEGHWKSNSHYWFSGDAPCAHCGAQTNLKRSTHG